MLTDAQLGDVVQVVSPITGTVRLAMLRGRWTTDRWSLIDARGSIETWPIEHMRWPQLEDGGGS